MSAIINTCVWSALWCPWGLAYLAMLLAGLAAGLWPQAIYPPWRIQPVPLPTLQCVIVAQAAFVLMIHPLILRPLAAGRDGGRYVLAAAAQSTLLLLLAAPLYVAAAFVADATLLDVLRSALYIATLWPLAWWGGWVLNRSAGPAAAGLLLVMLAGLGLPAAWYIARDLLNSPAAETLWRLCPLLESWGAAASRSGGLIPSPAWPLLAWPLAAAVLSLATMLGATLLRPVRAKSVL